jgi:hypothetical protein
MGFSGLWILGRPYKIGGRGFMAVYLVTILKGL